MLSLLKLSSKEYLIQAIVFCLAFPSMDPKTNIPPVKAGYWYCNSNFPVVSIDSKLFTHLFAAFAEVDTTSFIVNFPAKYMTEFKNFRKTVKDKNPKVKALLSIGTSDPTTFALMVSQDASRQTFIQSSVKLATDYEYDGLSLHWQYPYTSDQMNNLGVFLKEWREYAKSSRLILTAAVFYSAEDLSSLKYPIQAIVENLDWINVMAYDMYTPDYTPKVTGPPAPLYNPTSQLSADTGIRAWIQAGVPANKLVLGLPFHGRSWVRVPAHVNNHEMFSPANGAAPEIDPIPYSDIIKKGRTGAVFDASYVTHYWYDNTTWIGYDDKHSIYTKVRYAKKKGLLGYFAWHVDDDDSTADWTLSTKAFNAWDEDSDHE